MAVYLGLDAAGALKLVEQQGWAFDAASNLVTPTRPADGKLRHTNLQQLQQLTEYVVALEM